MKLSLKEFFVLKEYEDPTSSKNAEGDSKWSSPFSKKERVPHLAPQSDAQNNSADGWKQSCKDGPKQSSSQQIKDFFGGAHAPKDVDEGPALDALNARGNFGSKKPRGDDKKDAAEAERNFYGDSIGEPSDNPDLYPGLEKPYTGDDNEVPSGDLDNYGSGYGEDDFEHGTQKDPYEMTPEELRAWAGADDSPIEKSAMYDDEPQQGHSPFDPNWADTTAFNDDEPARTSRGSGDGFDDGAEMEEVAEGDDDKDEEEFLNSLMGDLPTGDTGPGAMAKGGAGAADEMDDLGDMSGIDLSQMDDDSFLDQLTAMDAGNKKKGEPRVQTPSDEFSWDEFRASHPDEAQEAELRFSEDELAGATFKKKKSGFMTATLDNGRRLLYMGDDRGWFDMDDEGTPAGEF